MVTPDGAMTRVVREFREFALRGNAVDLAVGVVFGVAFGALIASLVDYVLLQIIAGIAGESSFAALVIPFGDAEIRLGAFIDAIVNFFFVALALFFIVKTANAADRARRASADSTEENDEDPSEEILLLREIRDALREGR